MMKKFLKTSINIIILGILINKNFAQNQQRTGGCSTFLNIRNLGVISESDTSYAGQLHFKLNETITNLFLDILFDNPIESITADIGDFIQVNSKLYRLVKINYFLWQNQHLELNFIIKFKYGQAIPNIMKITLNNNKLCERFDSERFHSIPMNYVKGIQTGNKQQGIIKICDDPDLIEFQFDSTISGRYSAILRLDATEINHKTIVEITFDKIIYIIGTTKSPSKSSDSQVFYITLNDSPAGRSFIYELKFFVKYNDLEKRPKIERIRLDNEILCESPFKIIKNTGKITPVQSVTKSTVKAPAERPINLLRTSPLPISLSPEKFSEWILYTPPKTDTPDINVLPRDCSQYVPEILDTKIGGGTQAEVGQFPWHAAIYSNKGNEYTYDCGATLVSLKAVITAAHCVTRYSSKKPIRTELFLVYLGLYSLRYEMGGEQIRKVINILVNPEYDSLDNYYSDIAIMKFAERIKITDQVVPICLWNHENDDINLLQNKLGTVPGWGLNELGSISVNLTFIEMPVLSRQTCLLKNRDFYTRLLKGRSFCAGKGNGESVCNGDSGGGMIFQDEKYIPRLRGIVSVGFSLENTNSCDLRYYPVFTDVAQFLPWIRQNVI